MPKLNERAVEIDLSTRETDRERASGVFLTKSAATPRHNEPKVVELDTTGIDPNRAHMDETGLHEPFEIEYRAESEPMGLPGNFQERYFAPPCRGWISRISSPVYDQHGNVTGRRTRKTLRKVITVDGFTMQKRCGTRHNNGRKRRSHRDVGRAERLLTDKVVQAERADENYSHLEWLMATIEHSEFCDWVEQRERKTTSSPIEFILAPVPTQHGWIDRFGEFLSDPHTDHQCALYARTEDGRPPIAWLEMIGIDEEEPPLDDEELANFLRANTPDWSQPSEPIIVEPHRLRYPSRDGRTVRRMPPAELKSRKPPKPRRTVMRVHGGFETFPEGDQPDLGLDS